MSPSSSDVKREGRRQGFHSTDEFDEGCDTFEAAGGEAFGKGSLSAKGKEGESRGALGSRLKGMAADAAVDELDDSEELEGIGDPYRAARSVVSRKRRSAERKKAAASDAGGAGGGTADTAAQSATPTKHSPAGNAPTAKPAETQRAIARPKRMGARNKRRARRGKPSVMESLQRRRNYAASRAAATAKAEEAAAAGASKARSACAIASTLSSIAAPLAGIAAGLLAAVVAMLAVSSLLGAIFGFWENERSKASLDGLPSYITYDMVVGALECQEKYGHPAGCTLAQIICESGQGDHMSTLAERDNNLFGIKWSSSFASCPEVSGKSSWSTQEEYGGGKVTVMADFTVFKSAADCITFRSRVLLQNSRYADNAIIKEAIAKHDSDKMAEGLKDAGYATDSSYVDNLKSVMSQYNLYRFDGLSVSDFESGTASGNAIVAAAYSQLGVPYVWGGSTAGQGLDCSGLTQYCYAQAGIRISHYSEDQLKELTVVPLSMAQPGDILYKPGHVAIYVGDGKLIEEPQSGQVCRISTDVSRFTCALRYTK